MGCKTQLENKKILLSEEIINEAINFIATKHSYAECAGLIEKIKSNAIRVDIVEEKKEETEKEGE